MRVRRRSDRQPRPRARRQVWAFGATAIAIVAVLTYVSVRPLDSGRVDVRQIQRDDLALQRVLELRATLADLQLFIEPQLGKLSTAAAAISPGDIAIAAGLIQRVAAETVVAANVLRPLGFGADAAAIVAVSATLSKALTALSPLIVGQPSAVGEKVVAAERAAYTKARVVTAATATSLRKTSASYAKQSVGRVDRGRVIVLIVDAIAVLIAVVAAGVFGQRLHRRERRSRVNAKRRTYEATLQQALEMSKTESDAYAVMTKALEQCVPHLQVEMLVADSSRAHFHQTVHTEATEEELRSGCPVASPLDCPATRRGHTLVFPSSRELNACPYLIGRPSGDLSATCVAVSITGKTSAVVHATGPDGVPSSESDVQYLEITSRRSAERIAMLRAFEKSEIQARTDPLTGLWNRRSLENRAHDLAREGTPYALAYGDLDHFKLLNDTHGHEAGDQALRLFARVLRDSLRPTDLSARYGGEEFVIVLPDCSTETAMKVLERLRERLALALANGRGAAFTVSFGLAASTDADTFDAVVAIADEALLTAKSDGRNRTVLAGAAVSVAPAAGVSS